MTEALIEQPQPVARPTPDEALARLDALQKGLPDPEWEPIPARRKQIEDAATRIDNLRMSILMPRSNLADLTPRMPPLKTLHGTLTAIRAELCEMLLAANPAAFAGREHTREQDRAADIKLGISCLDRGPTTIGNITYLGAALSERMAAHGLTPMPGQPSSWNGRGTIAQVERRIAELQERIDHEQARLDAALDSVDRAVAFVTEVTARA